MDESPTPPTAPSVGSPPATGSAPVGTEVPRFEPLRLPSAPFWVVLIAGIAAVALLLAAASALLVFAIGIALSSRDRSWCPRSRVG